MDYATNLELQAFVQSIKAKLEHTGREDLGFVMYGHRAVNALDYDATGQAGSVLAMLDANTTTERQAVLSDMSDRVKQALKTDMELQEHL